MYFLVGTLRKSLFSHLIFVSIAYFISSRRFQGISMRLFSGSLVTNGIVCRWEEGAISLGRKHINDRLRPLSFNFRTFSKIQLFLLIFQLGTIEFVETSAHCCEFFKLVSINLDWL